MLDKETLRAGLISWIHSMDLEKIQQLHRIRRSLDSNLRMPNVPAGWVSIHQVAQRTGHDVGHLARLCREIYAPQELARKFTARKGRRAVVAWHLTAEAADQIPATPPVTDAPTQRQPVMTLDLRSPHESSSPGDRSFAIDGTTDAPTQRQTLSTVEVVITGRGDSDAPCERQGETFPGGTVEGSSR